MVDFSLHQPLKSLIVEWEIWDLILTHTKNRLVSQFDDKRVTVKSGHHKLKLFLKKLDKVSLPQSMTLDNG